MATETIRKAAPERPGKSAQTFVDCDVHNALPANDTLRKYIPQRWHKDLSTGGKQWLGGALASALNDWMTAEWLGRDPRMYGAITIPTEDGVLAAQEIRRAAQHRRFVQVLMFSRTRDPMGHRRYWPIYEAAAEAGLPVA